MKPKDRVRVLSILDQSDVQLTAQALIKEITRRFFLSPREARQCLKSLVEAQELTYRYQYGTTYVEKSFLKPVRISDHFVVQPPWSARTPGENSVVIRIDPGISFGSGQHPTTRLCMEAIDFCFFNHRIQDLPGPNSGADVGTGSGILAMAMCLAGLSCCRAYEIDPVSVCEAGRNIELNSLSKAVSVIEGPMVADGTVFSIITANLRYPTLAHLCDTLESMLLPNGIAVLSGFREWEKKPVLNTYAQKGFQLIRQKEEKNWACFVLIKQTGG